MIITKLFSIGSVDMAILIVFKVLSSLEPVVGVGKIVEPTFDIIFRPEI